MSKKTVVLFHQTNSCRENVSEVLKKQKLDILFRSNIELKNEGWCGDVRPDIILVEYQEEFHNLYLNIISEMDTPVIFITNPANEEKVYRLIQAGAYDYIFSDRLKKLLFLVSNIGGKKRSKAEEQLQASIESYKYLFKNNPLPNIIYDTDSFEIVDANEAAVKYYNYSYEEFLKLTVLDFLPREEVLRLQRFLLKEEKKVGELLQKQTIHLKKGSSPIPVETYGYSLNYKGRNCRLVICLDISEREMYLDQIKQKSLQLEAAQQIAKIGYWNHHLNSNDFYWSEEVFKIWERDEENFTTNLQNFKDIIHPDDLKKFNEENAKALTGDTDLNFEHRIITPEGKIKWVHERGKVSINSNGESIFEGTCQDITEEKQIFEKLLQAESRQRGILQSQTNYLIRTDLDGNYSYCNEKFVKDFSWIFPNKKIIGRYAKETIHDYHYSRVQETFAKCIANPNIVYQIEIDKLQQDGGAKTTLWDFICLTDASGNPVELQCVGIDITDRVRTQKSLEESNVRNELVLKATSDAIYDWDIKSDYLFWGEAFYAIFGFSQIDFTQTIDFWMEQVHPEEKDQLIKSLTRVLEGTENHWEAEYRFKKEDGKYAFVTEKGFILRDKEGKAFRMVGAIQDITERKKLEELLDEASKLARIGSFEIDYVNDTMYWSPVTKEIHEVDMNYVPSKEKEILFYKEGESREVMSSAYMKAVEENVTYDLELQIITAKGRERWIRKIGRPTFVDGKCIRINGSFQDITNIKNSQLEALKASEEKETILESIGDAFYTVDNNWTITYWNKHAEKLLESKKEEILGKNLWEVFPDIVNTKFHSCFNKAVNEQSIEDFEEYFERVKKWFDVTAYPSPGGLSVYFRDVTERKESELRIIELNKDLKAYTDELVTANKGLEQFSYIISHNLRAPVANIMGLGNLIKEDHPPEIKIKFQEELLSNVKGLDTIIRDLNEILQVKVDISEKKEPVDLLELVETVKSGIGQVIEKENVEIITHFEVSSISSIRTYLHSVFSNLIYNSVKYRRPEVSSIIEITSEKRAGGVFITFKDNGMGINLSKKGDQIFGLYKRFHNHVEGKGMGLFMVKTQVELMGGKIHISSEVNKGTEFTIEFKADKDLIQIEDEEPEAVYNS